MPPSVTKLSSDAIFEPDPEFRAQVRADHADAFALAAEVARTVADAVIRPVSLPDEVSRAIDILMQQAWKAHSSVCVLAERTYFEDAHTILRRLLEIGAQTTYIAGPTDPGIRHNRAIRFLARLWHLAPSEVRSLLPPADRKEWEAWYVSWKSQLPAKPQSWWPTFREILSEVGRGSIYEQDYRFLCGIAHGTPSLYLRAYAGAVSDEHFFISASVLLTHATRYYITVAHHWNSVFNLISTSTLDELSRKAFQKAAQVTAGPDSKRGSSSRDPLDISQRPGAL